MNIPIVQRWREARSAGRRLDRDIHETLRPNAEGAFDPIEQRAARLKDLQALKAAVRAHSPARRLERVIIILAAVVAALVTAALSVRRVPVTAVDAEITSSELAFTLAEDGPVLGPLNVEEASFHDTAAVLLPDSSPLSATLVRIRARRGGPPSSDGVITLPGFRLPAHGVVTVRHEGANGFTVTLDGPLNQAYDVAAKGTVTVDRISSSGVSSSPLHRASLSRIRVEAPGPRLTIAFTLARDATAELSPHLPVSALSFLDSDAESVRLARSAIRSGSLQRSDVTTERTTVHRAEQVILSPASRDVVWPRWSPSMIGRTLPLQGLRVGRVALSSDGVASELGGNVSDLRYGSSAFTRNAMPSELEWLAANRSVQLVWTAMAFAAGMVLGLARWFGTPRA